jgi:hypothetical protein
MGSECLDRRVRRDAVVLDVAARPNFAVAAIRAENFEKRLRDNGLRSLATHRRPGTAWLFSDIIESFCGRVESFFAAIRLAAVIRRVARCSRCSSPNGAENESASVGCIVRLQPPFGSWLRVV